MTTKEEFKDETRRVVTTIANREIREGRSFSKTQLVAKVLEELGVSTEPDASLWREDVSHAADEFFQSMRDREKNQTPDEARLHAEELLRYVRERQGKAPN